MNYQALIQNFPKAIFLTVAFVSCFGNASADPIVSKQVRPFSTETNYMSPVGFARWQYLQEHKEWPPSVIKEVIAESPVYGGFNWVFFLRSAQAQTKKYPYARTFVNSWHIDTIGLDWRDDYYIVKEYRRSAGAVWDPNAYKGPKPLYPLNDDILSQLLKEWDDVYIKTKDGYKAEEQMMLLWESYKSKP